VYRVICLGNRAENDGASLRACSAYSFSLSRFLYDASAGSLRMTDDELCLSGKISELLIIAADEPRAYCSARTFFSAPTLCTPWPSLIVQGCSRRCTRVHS